MMAHSVTDMVAGWSLLSQAGVFDVFYPQGGLMDAPAVGWERFVEGWRGVTDLGVLVPMAASILLAAMVMSRTQAKKTFEWSHVQKYLDERGVTLLSAGLDEVPMVYKNIDEVMAAQEDLVESVARFQPSLVKMAPAGERPED